MSKNTNKTEEQKDSLTIATGTSYRDSVGFLDKTGKRMFIMPKKPKGKLYNWRSILGYFLLVIFFLMPFLKISGNPVVMFNIFTRQFTFFGLVFWPQDLFLIALVFLAFLFFTILFTAIYGRLWCGWACPQTVLMEILFRKIEYFIDGDANAQRKLAIAPWNFEKFVKRSTKHIIFLVLSFTIVFFLYSYFSRLETLWQYLLSGPAESPGFYTAWVLLSLVTYAVYIRFREQICVFICPYGRLQSVLLDKNSVVISYDYKRGEPRGFSKKESDSLGDCVDDNLCVAVCPTAIDIRNGIQLECVNCAACIDACNSIMQKLNKPKGLIRYASENMIEKREKFRITPRIVMYSIALFVLLVIVSILMSTRSDVETTLLRAKGQIYQLNENNEVVNIYTAKIFNKTYNDIPIELKVEEIPGSIELIGHEKLILKSDKMIEVTFLVKIPQKYIKKPKNKIRIGIYSGTRQIEEINTIFSGPGMPVAGVN